MWGGQYTHTHTDVGPSVYVIRTHKVNNKQTNTSMTDRREISDPNVNTDKLTTYHASVCSKECISFISFVLDPHGYNKIATT